MNQAANAATGDAPSPPHVLVIFGASGDLAHRKIFPALADLAQRGRLAHNTALIGIARTPWSDEEFRRTIHSASALPSPAWDNIVSSARYIAGEYDDQNTFDRLKGAVAEAENTLHTHGNRIFYLATVPDAFATVATALGREGLNTPGPNGSFSRIVIEKPYGHDGKSAHALDDVIHQSFSEDQIYRIDHYMGKETVQNLLALRFANAIFEPIWNHRYVEQVQITVAESLGVEHRGGFYEHAGALRDIVQNHVMQVLALTLMEPPTGVDAAHVRDEKVKLLRAVDIPTPDEAVDKSIRGQYRSATVGGKIVKGYREEDDVDPQSVTETYAALRLRVENWRWAGVPIYIRTGKRLPARVTEVAMQFRRVPFLAFDGELSRDLRPNTLVLRIQPDEGISLHFGAKVPGERFRVQSVAMEFRYHDAFASAPETDGYPRLLHDAMCGDPTLFIRSDEVAQAWKIVDPYLEAWSEPGGALHFYDAGTWGPHFADLLLERSGDAWRVPIL